MLSRALTAGLLLLVAGHSAAEVVPAKYFADGMIIQRDEPVTIWGIADPGEPVQVRFLGGFWETFADDAGHWELELPARSSGRRLQMTVGKRTISDIAFGDVWLASGQSNMQFKLREAKSRYPQELDLANYPDIRQFAVAKNYNFKGPQRDFNAAHWHKASRDSVGNFSAVAWFFAKELSATQNVPVGIINSSVGATPVESWMSYHSLDGHPSKQRVAQGFSNDQAVFDFLEQAKEKAQAENSKPERIEPKPTGLYNAMIAPAHKIRIKGIIWYQGEGNTPTPHEYADLFSRMIMDWRERWGQGDVPFLYVQLANFMKPSEMPAESSWAELRQAQTEVETTLPNTAMALAIDVGEANNIHPLDKKTVGQRLALAARALAYGESDLVFRSPKAAAVTCEGNKLVVSFDRIGEGLAVQGETLRGFAVAGHDGDFVWAEARLENDQVVVWNDTVSEPVRVRYAWAQNPVNANLYSAGGLPAVPFSLEVGVQRAKPTPTTVD